MALHIVRKGLDLPIGGKPVQEVYLGSPAPRVGLLAADYVGMRPAMLVSMGDHVKRGQPLFTDKKTPGVVYTAPGAGRVVAVNRGARRSLLSVVIELTESEMYQTPGPEEMTAFASYTGKRVPALSRSDITALLVESGLWAAFRTRPFSKTPAPGAPPPHSIFITAIDTHPLAASVDAALAGKEEAFLNGQQLVAKLTDGAVYLCKAPGSAVAAAPHAGIEVEEFAGVHPAGTVGFHIHTLDPVHREKVVWHLGYQDVAAIGTLFQTGVLDVSRVVALGGPSVQNPRLLSTRLGASTDALAACELVGTDHRIISGSVLSGRTAMGDVTGYLGRYHTQISALPEGREREFLGWLRPGAGKYSVTNAFLSAFFRTRARFDFTTALNGSPRAIVPLGAYERVMPMDILATFLLRSLAVQDVDRAEQLGCLELDEEDLSLCTFVDPGKQDFGSLLRQTLNILEKEG